MLETKMSLIFLISAILLITVGSVNGKEYQFRYQKNIDAAEVYSLSINNTSGLIEITGADVAGVSIEAIKRIDARNQTEAEEEAARIDIEADRTDREIIIETVYGKSRHRSASFWDKLFGSDSESSGSVNYKITVPRRLKLEVENVSGEIIINDINESVFIRAVSGNIDIENISAPVEISAVSGDIRAAEIKGDFRLSATSSRLELSRITGALDIKTTSGDMRIEEIIGPARISQTSGRIELTGLTGDLTIRSMSGDISLEQNAGTIEIASESGNVDVKTKLDSPGEYSVETSSGAIYFRVPDGSGGSVRIETASGDIRADMPINLRSHSDHRVVGQFGTGGPKIFLASTSGDINIREY